MKREAARAVFRLTSLLLQYPDAELVAAFPALRQEVDALTGAPRKQLAAFIKPRLNRPLRELQEEYVRTFDTARKISLYVTYPVHGERRERGMALIQLRAAYREAGLQPDPRELPDFLPTMLEFAWLEESGVALLGEHRPSIELLAVQLRDSSPEYAGVVDAVLHSLPRLAAAQRKVVRALLESGGPPEERVGLDPYAPGDAMPAALMEMRR